MNPLELLKEKLRVKPIIEEKQKVSVAIPIANAPEKVEISKITLLDERGKESGFSRRELIERLKENKMTTVLVKPTVKESIVSEVSGPVLEKKKVKKLPKKLLFKLEEDEPEKSEEEQLGDEEPIAPVVEEPKKRRTKRPLKGVSLIPPEEWVDIDKIETISRLPPKKPHVNIKVSSYFMNNREKFVNFINSLFGTYRDTVMDDSKQISCDSIGQDSVGDFSLLTHQNLVRDYLNLYTPYRGLLLYHGLGAGKCHRKGTPIMMSDGKIKLIENIKVGDLLMGDDSKPRTVLSLARGQDKMYDVIPIKGEKYTVNQEHILCLKASGFPKFSRNNHKHNTNYNVQWIENNKFQSKTFTINKLKDNEEKMKIEAELFFENIKTQSNTSDNVYEISIKDYLKLSEKKKGFLKGYKVPIDFPEKELQIDPYMIGYWLGDGSSRGSSITCQDSTVLHYFAHNLKKYNLSLNYKSHYDYGISGNGRYYNNVFLNTLKELNMIKNKHIPEIYKCNSRENRLKLLGGLIDSDGSYDKNKNAFEFTNTNETLMDDVIFLARSLGFSCYKHIKETSWTYKGEKKYGTAWRICINGNGVEKIATQIPRKRASPRRQIKDALVTGITVKYVNEDDYYGFMLDGNCRYIMGDFTVTHNTCTSIAIAEGFKSKKKIIVMTPASLRRNYMEELKKCGDSIYKKNQFWQWISTRDHPEAAETLSSVLNLSIEYINKKKGAWLVNTTKPSNYHTLESQEIKSLDDQIDEMIQYKYKFINYNGLRRDKLKDMTNNFETNIFDDAVIVIDEAHNFISRIVNKIAKEKEAPTDKYGKKERVPYSMALILYELLLSAKNARIVLLTGTPIINYPNEIGILFNILRGYIKTWEIPLDIRSGQSVTKEKLQEIFTREKVLDYIDYSKDKVITITRNPFGFENKYKEETGYHGVTNKPITIKNADEKTHLQERGTISDMDFEKRIISILESNKIGVNTAGIQIKLNKALPDKFDDFAELFLNTENGNTKNMDLFKRRIIGLTSYFRSAQESLMPRYEKLVDFHVIKIPMSAYQFTVYEAARALERKQETSTKQKKGVIDENGIYKDPSSTYRIFSRLYCNFVMPKPPGRPLPREEREEDTQQLENIYEDALKETSKKGANDLEGDAWDGELEGDEVIEKLADSTYEKRIQTAIDFLKANESTVLSPRGLEEYSPKYLNILENIQDPMHIGLHLVYSQFRTLEGIGIFKMVLEANGFTQFKVKKDSNGVWDLDISEENMGKPTFALYTGTESAEEKELIRNIYNSNWDTKSPITAKLKEIAHNNHMGEIIKVLMITASGSEGINLRSTRYVHIMEPYWNPARIDQVVGRARRICSHKELPEALQTVEVYLYLMTFSKEQLDPKNDNAIELKRKDKSKRKYKIPVEGKDEKDWKEDNIPLTSDEALFEISTIKDEVSFKLMTAIKEASIDCAVYTKRGSKEQLNCLQFGEPSSKAFSYIPNYKKQEPDSTTKINKKTIEWRGKPYEFRGKKYIYRKIDSNNGKLYDWDSYYRALENPQIDPILIAEVEQTPKGVKIKMV